MKIVCDKNTKRKTIIKALNHIMLDMDIKNKDIIDKLDMSKQTVSNLYSTSYRPDSSMTIDTLYMLCDAIGCQLTLDITPKICDNGNDEIDNNEDTRDVE